MARVTADDVVAIMPDLCADNIEMDAQISQAHYLANRVHAKDTKAVISEEGLRLIELNLAAHFYSFYDQQYQSKSTSDASAVFQGKTDMYLDYSPWGQKAKLLDETGFLASLEQQAKSGRKKVGLLWLGTKGRNDQSIY